METCVLHKMVVICGELSKVEYFYQTGVSQKTKNCSKQNTLKKVNL